MTRTVAPTPASEDDPVVTGIGVVAPNGVGADYWPAVLRGENGIGPLTRFDPEPYASRLAGEVDAVDPAGLLPGRLLPQTDPVTRLSLVAADWALADAGIDPAALPDYAAGVVTASSAGGFAFGQRELQNLWSSGPSFVSAYQSFAWFYAVNTGQISIRNGLRGPSGVVVADQAGGLDALAQARRLLRNEHAAVVTGGVDSVLCPWGWVALQADGGMSCSADPARAFRPFDVSASGWVPGEGGAIMVLERADSARTRGVTGYGRVAGYAATFDPPPGAGRPRTLARAIGLALADGGLDPADIDVVFADGAGNPADDAAEAAAITEVFGPGGVPVTVPKALTGRLLSGGAPLDVSTALLALKHGVIPATAHVTTIAPACRDLDLVLGAPRCGPLASALVLARGRRGFNSAMVLRAVRDTPSRGDDHD